MTFDTKVPSSLKTTQQWFASIITRPIDLKSRMNSVSPSGRPVESEAADYIAPSRRLKPAQRIQIYNQQYWWRLLTVMHDNFPTVTRLFGYQDFNQTIAFPYLVAYPSDNWTLGTLGNHLVKWIEETYVGDDKQLVSDAAQIDWAFNEGFVAAQKKGIDVANALTPDDFSSLLACPLVLQPYVYLFEMPYDLFEFRKLFMEKEPDYWVEHDFPVLKHHPEQGSFYFVLYRNRQNDIAVDTITSSEFQLLKRFKERTTIDNICEWLEQQPEESEIVLEASQKLHVWFQRWIAHNFFETT